MSAMSERVSSGAAGKQLGVSGGDLRRAGYTKVTTALLEAWEHEPPAWLRKAIGGLDRPAELCGAPPGCKRPWPIPPPRPARSDGCARHSPHT